MFDVLNKKTVGTYKMNVLAKYVHVWPRTVKENRYNSWNDAVMYLQLNIL